MNTKGITLAVLVLVLGLGYYFFSQNTKEMTSAEAIALVQKEVPELVGYPADTLPPKRIETKETETGWLVGFFMEGSGVKGILDAKCYAVSKEGVVESTGSYQADDTPPAEKIELSNCTPTNAAPIQVSTTSLTAKKWTWAQSFYNDGRRITPKKDVFTLTFLNDGTFAVTTDCNGGAGKYTKTDSQITFTDIVRTEMACGDSQESEFITMLEHTSGYHFGTGGELILDLKFDSGSVVFK